jgi:AraC-like DNA-binding protein
MDPIFHYSERACPPSLSPWLWNYWEFRVESESPSPVAHHVPPDGSTSIALVVRSARVQHAAVSGPWLEPLVVPVIPGFPYYGVRFRPESGALALGVKANRLLNQNQPLASLGPVLNTRLTESIAGSESFDQVAAAMDGVFGDHLHQVSHPDDIARDAVNLLIASRGEMAIAALATALGLAPRTLLRRFRTATGLSPKQFARICRFRHAAFQLMEANRPGWAQVASGTGFADQAHMIHEFKDLTGLTPEGLGKIVGKTSHGDLVL